MQAHGALREGGGKATEVVLADMVEEAEDDVSHALPRNACTLMACYV